MIAKLVVWALKARGGLAALVTTANLSGLAVIVTQLWLNGFLGRLGPDWVKALAFVGIYPAVGFLAGIVLAVRDRKVYFGWLDAARKPTEAEARRLLLLPIAISLRALALWIPGVIVATATFAHLSPDNDPGVTAALFTIGAFESAAVTFLIVDRLIRPTIPVVAGVLGWTMHWSASVLVRVVVTWAVAAALPLLMLIVVLADPAAAAPDRVRTAIYLSGVGIGVGALATAFLARSVAAPMRTLRRALDRIAQGDLGARVPIGSTSEIGRLEHSVNELAANLRERERMREVFGRHVGTEVAERALARGADLTGDVREVSALFVDVTGSVELSTGLPPQEFVAKLNRLLSIVVAATEENNGLVNKFEGDAALCVFGAPIALRDNATPALRAARRIRDEVIATGELDIGIGVARGPVFAGDVGSDTRLEFTVIGDAVNEAARLTTAAKEVPRRILVSQAVIDAATDHESAKWTFYDSIVLRGMKEPTACWTDCDTSGAHPERTATHNDQLDGRDLPPDTNPVIDIHTAAAASDNTGVPDIELDAPPRR
ncbi:adenylate/guanylate cyclase domain-containing protein [Nocardia gipuzkoensis]|uniref:adenylate/guanylate cyclase domain-containing protein n=1 Tax=Nocardia gipuzkoensis TaxID=2749991 RepID=UPI001E4EC9A4|nr:adenylate/guanylate cyclase domain-containing protein [Nocardia gipuzkoensis]UGT65376.1 adenylate/guanylate cyclase domain-containing protein [Nocardia gipuzkoensis]